MIFHSSFGVFLAFLLLVAFSGNFSGVKAEEFVCDITLEFATWEDASLPKEDILVPDMNLLKYGIPHVLTERFDILAGAGNWMTDHTFQSYQLKEAKDEDYDDYDENDFHRHLRRKKKKIRNNKKKKKKKPQIEPQIDEEKEADPNGDDPDSNQPIRFNKPGEGWNIEYDDDWYDWRRLDSENLDEDAFNHDYSEHAFDSPEDESIESHRELRNRFTHDDDRPFPGTMPYSCWKSHRCRSEYMKKKINRNRNKGRIRIGMCNLCEDSVYDDDDPAKQEALANRARDTARRKKRAQMRKNGKRMLLTVDQLVGGIEEQHPDLGGSIAAHLAFEQNVCAELSNLRDDFDSLKTIEDCKIHLHCQAYMEGDFEDVDEFTIVDNRDVEEAETNEDNRGLLSSFAQWSMGDDDEEGENLYSVTAIADL